jgi:c-di-GMP phosphodiesterase
MADMFIARQPIFDLDGQLVGYELLYRSTATATSAGSASLMKMSSSTLVAALLTIGLEQLTGGARAFINFPRELLVHHAFELLDPDRVTIELLESVSCDPQSVAAVRALRLRGFELALDDFAAGEEYDPFLRSAQIVKVDVLGATRETLEPLVRRLKRYPTRLLAERVEGPDMYALCRSLGFTLFQGYFLQRPETLGRRDLPAELSAIVRVMNLVADPRATDRELEIAFRDDPGLSFKLLRIVNSAAIGGLGVDSIQHAVQMVGRSTLHRWLSLLFLTALPTGAGVQRELALEALERGRMCELLALNAGHPQAAAPAFLAGLLSRFDAILGISMPDLLSTVHVAPDVQAALLNTPSRLTPYLAVASLYVQGNWEPTIEMATRLGVLDELLGWYSDAGDWARAVLHAA